MAEGLDAVAAEPAAERLLQGLGKALLVLASLANLAIFAVVLLAVVMRYVAGAPLPMTEELAGLLLAMSVFLVMPLSVVANLNIRVTLLTGSLTGAARRVAWVTGELILAAFLAIFAKEAWTFYTTALRFREKSEQAQLVLAPWKLAAFALLVICLICALWRAWRPPPKAGGTVI